MKSTLFKALPLGICLVAVPCFAQTAQVPDDKSSQPKAASPAPQVPPAPQADPQEPSHQSMVEEQERRDREEQAERDRDDQARQTPVRPLPGMPPKS